MTLSHGTQIKYSKSEIQENVPLKKDGYNKHLLIA